MLLFPLRRVLSGLVRARPILLPPGVPTGLAALANGASEIDLTWNPVAGAVGYRVERSSDGASGWLRISSPAGAAYADTGLPGGTTRYYRVRSYNGVSDSDPSSVVNATTTGGALDYGALWAPQASYAFDEANGNAIAALGGLDLVLHGACPAGAGELGGARQTENPIGGYFDHADHPLFRIGNFDWALAFWVYIDPASMGTSSAIVSKDAGTAGYHTRLQADGTVLWIVRQAGGADYARKANSTVLTASAWHFVMVYIDVAAPEVGISIDGGVFEVAAAAGTPGAGAAAFSVGATVGDPGVRAFFDELTIFNPPAPGIGSLKTAIRDRLWNAGAGRAYPWA